MYLFPQKKALSLEKQKCAHEIMKELVGNT